MFIQMFYLKWLFLLKFLDSYGFALMSCPSLGG